MTKFDLLWSRVTRVMSFLGGLAIMGYETIGDRSDRPWLYAAAVGMMGLPIARAAEGVLSHFSSGGPQVIPAKVEQPAVTEESSGPESR